MYIDYGCVEYFGINTQYWFSGMYLAVEWKRRDYNTSNPKVAFVTVGAYSYFIPTIAETEEYEIIVSTSEIGIKLRNNDIVDS